MRLVERGEDQDKIWHIRESGVGASRVPGEEEAWPSWEDAAVPPERLGDYLRDFAKLNERYGYKATIFGHFGDGCVHARMTFGLKTADGVAQFRAYMEEASDLCLAYGGSLSGEHGDGQAKGELLPKMFGPELIEAFREFKSIWDPHWRMNPGKVIDAYPLDSNLRLGPEYVTRPVETHFRFPEDGGSFAHATERCFGVGKCRSLGGQTMCPSFQATREEMHSTRGRAHLLFEMVRGDTLEQGWRDEHVREALDLCLQCKGCKGDCPVSVDMATYKAEFLAHYYAGRLRPRAAYSMGLIHRWARLASFAPGLDNLLTQTPLLRDAVGWLAGVTPHRPPPQFAPETFQSWFRRRPVDRAAQEERPVVILWPDTFNNHFLPGTARAAVAVLETAGFRVVVPGGSVCCGRPYYDYGMLDAAKRQLRATLETLRPAIRAGVPVVGLEPSCVSVFRDEMVNLLPDDEDARRLHAQTHLLSEFLARQPGYRPPRLARKAVMHAHCHHKALMGTADEAKLLEGMGVELEALDAGCCGLAGSFGYEREHYDVSMRIGEHALLPQVRAAAPEALVIADGFSCRLQIAHGTERRALHVAEVLHMAMRGQRTGAPEPLPERHYPPEAARAAPRHAAAAAGLGLAVLALALALRRRAGATERASAA
jgi:Fe-S oxidoreductase